MTAASSRLESWPLDRLRPARVNPRRHGEDDLAELAASIRRFGFRAPILATSDGEIVAGEGRWRAARSLGLEAVPVVIVEGLNAAERQAYLIADNRLAELSTWDEAELAQALDGFDELEGLGFTDADLEELQAGLEEAPPTPPEDLDPEDPPIPAPPANPVSRLGDVWTLGRHRLVCGDSSDPSSLEAALDGRLAASIVTDPPYGLGFMGKAWDRGIPPASVWATFAEHMLPGAMALVFGGTRTYHRLTCAIEDAGFEIRDCLSWLYGSGFPKSLDVSKAIDKAAGAEREASGKPYRVPDAKRTRPHFVHEGDNPKATTQYQPTAPQTEGAILFEGYGTALKPAWEPIVLAMKPLDGTFAQNALAHGVAGLNVDGGRIEAAGGSPAATRRASARKSGNVPVHHGEPAAKAEALGKIHNRSRPEVYTAERPGEAIGRWPANVALDTDAAAVLDEQSGESKDGVAVRRHGNQGLGIFPVKIAEGSDDVGFGGAGGASRFFYTAKASRTDRGEGNDHPTVKPTALIEWLLRLTMPPPSSQTDGVVLEPFSGSGTTIIAGERIGRPVAAIELSPAYVDLAIRRWESLTGETARDRDGHTLAEIRKARAE